MKISVIIPVYNVEKGIKKTLDSIINQTIKDIEIIAVDDGSTDNSNQMIQEYIEEKKDNRIKLFKKENGGLSSARNYGVLHATGEYIAFIDAGDYIQNNLFENLKPYINKNIDLVKFKMLTVDESGKEIQRMDGPVFDICSGEEAFQKLCTTDPYLDVACIYLYRREFFIENHFQYNETKYHETYGGTYHEDFGLTPLVIIKADTVVSTEFFSYYYVQDNGSITRNGDYQKHLDRAHDLLVHYDNMINTLKEYKVSKKTEEKIKAYYTNSIILKIRDLQGKDIDSYIKEIKKRDMIKNIKVTNIKQCIKRILLSINIKWYLKIR